MYFKLQDKELKKIIDDIDKLIAKLIKFNINSICTLTFCLNKIDLSIFPIITHIDTKKNIVDIVKEHKILEQNNFEESLLSSEDVEKYTNDFDPLSIIHNVILSTEEIDLSLERDDKYLYTKPINIFILKKFKEFLSAKSIISLNFYYDEMLNTFNLEDVVLADSDNPLVLRQKLNYLNTSDLNINFYDYSRNFWINEDIKHLCDKYKDESRTRTIHLLSKDENNQEELCYSVDNTIIRISKEFFKANVKTLDFVYEKYETFENIKVISVLLHISYSNNHQYIFYQYYEV